jgi:hypothetical protein
MVENNGYLSLTFTADDYIKNTANYNIVTGAVISGSFQTFD